MKSNYIISNRDYTDDYSNTISKEIDMNLSGKYLYKYPNFKVNYRELGDYPTHSRINKLKEKLKLNLNNDRAIIIGSGSNGILQNIIKILFNNGGNLVTPFLTFNQAEYAVTSLNGYTKRVYLKEDYHIDFENMIKCIDTETKMAYICNPNNPTGIIESCSDIINFANIVNIPVVVDETSIDFSNHISLLNEILPDNIIVLRSFSKAYGLANLRIGYMICNNAFEEAYRKNITVNEVSGLSCRFVEKMLETRYMEENVKRIKKEKEKIITALEKIGIYFFDSDSNILMTKNTFNINFFKELEKREISVIPIYDEKNKLHFRIAIQTPNINQEFIKNINKIDIKKYEI